MAVGCGDDLISAQPPIVPREAFVAQDPDSIRIIIDSDDDQVRFFSFYSYICFQKVNNDSLSTSF